MHDDAAVSKDVFLVTSVVFPKNEEMVSVDLSHLKQQHSNEFGRGFLWARTERTAPGVGVDGA